MPAGDREVYERLPARADSARAVTMLADAVFAEERKHWIDLFRARPGREPTQGESDDWISDIVRQVRAASGWWRQYAIALMTAILAPLPIGTVIVSALAYGTALPSLVDLSAGLRELAPAGRD